MNGPRQAKRVLRREIDRDAGALLEVDELLDGLGGAEATLVDVGEERGERVATDAKAEPAQPLGEVVVATHRTPPGRAG